MQMVMMKITEVLGMVLEIYTSVPSKTQIDYIMVSNKDKKELEMLGLLLGRRLLSNTSS